MFDPILLAISREEVEARDTSGPMGVLKSCIASVEDALNRFEKLEIAFHGYDEDRRELSEIDEVSEYVQVLDDQFPYWLFFLSKRDLGLQAIMYCLMPPFLSELGRRTILPERLDQLLTKRWFPAMEQLCEAVGFTERQIEALTTDVANYFVRGPKTD